MLNLGLTEIIVIVVLAIVVVGPERLPEMMRFLGKQYGKLMRASHELRRAFMLEADKIEAEHRAAELRRRREEALKRANEAREATDKPPHLPAGSAPPPRPAAAPEAPVEVQRSGKDPTPGPTPAAPPDAGPAQTDDGAGT